MSRVYPHSNFQWIDQSSIPEINDPRISKPCYLYAFSADKGPEDMKECTYENFHKYYGNYINFAKHGQPLLQASVDVDSGGIVFAKRVVAPDSTLANAVVFATVTQGTEEQKVDEKGNKLYKHTETGNIVTESQKAALEADYQEHQSTVTEPHFTPEMVKPALIKYEVKSYEGQKKVDQIASKAIEEKTSEKFPLFVIADIGRGVSGKAFNITPDYVMSKTRKYMRYQLNTIENGEEIESLNICFNHHILESGINRSMYTVCKKESYNLTANVLYDSHDEFIAKVAEVSGNTEAYCNTHDLLFGYTVKRAKLNNIKLAVDSANLGTLTGIALENGTNGTFGDAPFGTDAYNTEVTKFYAGEIDDNIYDVDNYKFDVLMDANYPPAAKRAMEALAIFREDCLTMTDGGVEGLLTQEEIMSSANEVTKSKFVMYYPIYYDVIDPYSGKQITVTSNYSMSKLLISHFGKGVRFKPMAGELNGFVIRDAIEDTFNFIPKYTPKGNQKEDFSDNCINHLARYNQTVSFESVWTTQEEYTQLSFGNNVIAIQEVIKAIRDFCPANRFSVMYNDDIQAYIEDVNDIVNDYKDNFKSIAAVYLEDEAYEANKIFAAALSVECKDFNIAENYKIYVL